MARVLYKMDGSPAARTVMMVIDLLGLETEMRDLNPLLREQDQPEFAKKNPMRTIPIFDDGDFSLSDSHAIAIYLLDKYGKPEHEYLYPKDERKRATINQRLFFDCGVLFPRLRLIMAPTYSGRMTEIPRYNKLLLEDAYKILEEYLSQTLYIADDVMTIADISVFTTVCSLDGLHPVDEKRFPKLKRWIKTMSEKDVCKRINEEGSKMHVLNLKIKMELNKEEQEEKKQSKAKL